MSSIVLFLLLCASMHACNARRLGDIRPQAHHFVEDGEKTKLHGLSLLSIPLSFNSKKVQAQQQLVIGSSQRLTPESWGGANMMKEKDLKALLKKEEETRVISGIEKNEKIVVSSKEGLQQARTKLQGWKRQPARLMLGSTPQDTEETVDSKEEAGVVEDVVVMDYAQPHRKPPIHNEEH